MSINEGNPVCSCLEKGVCCHIIAVKKTLGENKLKKYNTVNLGKLVLSRNNSQKSGRKIKNHASMSRNQPLIGSAAAGEEETTQKAQKGLDVREYLYELMVLQDNIDDCLEIKTLFTVEDLIVSTSKMSAIFFDKR